MNSVISCEQFGSVLIKFLVNQSISDNDTIDVIRALLNIPELKNCSGLRFNGDDSITIAQCKDLIKNLSLKLTSETNNANDLGVSYYLNVSLLDGNGDKIESKVELTSIAIKTLETIYGNLDEKVIELINNNVTVQNSIKEQIVELIENDITFRDVLIEFIKNSEFITELVSEISKIENITVGDTTKTGVGITSVDPTTSEANGLFFTVITDYVKGDGDDWGGKSNTLSMYKDGDNLVFRVQTTDRNTNGGGINSTHFDFSIPLNSASSAVLSELTDNELEQIRKSIFCGLTLTDDNLLFAKSIIKKVLQIIPNKEIASFNIFDSKHDSENEFENIVLTKQYSDTDTTHAMDQTTCGSIVSGTTVEEKLVLEKDTTNNNLVIKTDRDDTDAIEIPYVTQKFRILSVTSDTLSVSQTFGEATNWNKKVTNIKDDEIIVAYRQISLSDGEDAPFTNNFRCVHINTFSTAGNGKNVNITIAADTTGSGVSIGGNPDLKVKISATVLVASGVS